MSSLTTTVGGTHRAGPEYIRQVVKYPDVANLLGKGVTVDPYPGRADEAANLFREASIPAEAFETSIEDPDLPRTNICTLLTDNALAMANVLESEPKEDLLQVNILAGTGFPPEGGKLIDYGGTISGGDAVSRGKAKIILRQISKITGGTRQTSRNISQRPLDSVQLEPVRQFAINRLSRGIYDYLQGKKQDSEIFAIQTLPSEIPDLYPVELVPEMDHLKPRDLEEYARERAEDTGRDKVAVVFYRPEEAWLFTTFLERKSNWLHPTWLRRGKSVELPIPTRSVDLYRRATRPAPDPNITATD